MAATTAPWPVYRHSVTDCDARVDPCADFVNNASTFVTERHGERVALLEIVLFRQTHHVIVGVTDTAGRHLQQSLAGPSLGNRNFY